MGHVIEIGIAKAGKWASRESGDTAEVVERPGGGFSVVVIDGQGSGAAAKSLSMMLTGQAVGLIKDGVRDGVVARAVHDHLLAYRGGKISASLDIVSVDAGGKAVVVTRNGTTPFVVVRGSAEPELIMPGEGPIGRYRFTRPSVWTYALDEEPSVWLLTDGITGAGGRSGGSLELRHVVRDIGLAFPSAAEQSARLLQRAIEADSGRPGDDMTVAVVRIKAESDATPIRQMTLQASVP